MKPKAGFVHLRSATPTGRRGSVGEPGVPPRALNRFGLDAETFFKHVVTSP
jgi:hypothetical protein